MSPEANNCLSTEDMKHHPRPSWSDQTKRRTSWGFRNAMESTLTLGFLVTCQPCAQHQALLLPQAPAGHHLHVSPARRAPMKPPHFLLRLPPVWAPNRQLSSLSRSPHPPPMGCLRNSCPRWKSFRSYLRTPHVTHSSPISNHRA